MPSQAIRNVVIRVSLEQGDAKLKVDASEALRAYAATQAAAEKAGAASVRASEQASAAVGEHADAIKAASRASETFAQQQQRSVDLNLRAAESLRTAGDGAFTLARGLALASSGNEENLRANLETIAAIQGGFDVFRGGVDLIRGGIEAQRALTAATAASAAAETARAGAVAATGAAATATTPALTAMNLALGPVGIAVAGIGAAAVAGVALWRSWGDEAEDAGDRAQRAMRRAIDETTLANRVLQDQRQLLRGFEGPGDQVFSIRQELANQRIASPGQTTESLDALQARRDELAERRSRIRSSQGGNQTRRNRLNGQISAVDARIALERATIADGADGALQAARDRQQLLGDLIRASGRDARDRLSDISSQRTEQERIRADATRVIDAARDQQLQRGRDFDQAGPGAAALLARATDADRLEDLSATELQRLRLISGTFDRQVTGEEDFRAGRIGARPETLQDQADAARGRREAATQTLETLDDAQAEIQREANDVKTQALNEIRDLGEFLRGLSTLKQDFEEFRSDVTAPQPD